MIDVHQMAAAMKEAQERFLVVVPMMEAREPYLSLIPPPFARSPDPRSLCRLQQLARLDLHQELRPPLTCPVVLLRTDI